MPKPKKSLFVLYLCKILKIRFPEIQSKDTSLSLLVGYIEYFIMFFRLAQHLKKE